MKTLALTEVQKLDKLLGTKLVLNSEVEVTAFKAKRNRVQMQVSRLLCA